MEVEKLTIIDEDGKEIEFDILFTFEDESADKAYVLYYDSEAEEPVVYASIYDEDGNLFEIDDPKEWDMVNEMFETFMENDEDDEDSDDDDDEDEDDEDEDSDDDEECDCCEGEDGCGDCGCEE